MSKLGSKKEFIFTLYLKKFPQTIENLIGVSIEGVRTEVNYGSKYVDLYAVNRDRKIEVFVENQITPSDKSDHLVEKITPLINNVSEGYLIWIASRFKQNHIDEVKRILRENPQKYINFYAVEIQDEVLHRIEYLNNLYELVVWDSLDSINEIDRILKLVDCHLQMPITHIGKAHIGERWYDFDRDDDIKEYVSVQLCEKIPYYLNLHTQKKHLMNDRTLTIGAGLGEITYFCSALDRSKRAVVGIRFEYSKQDWYHYFKQNMKLLQNNISQNLCFNDKYRTISYYIESDRENIPEVAVQIIEVFERFVLFFSPYTYGKKAKI
ncbi:hypothetical protein [Oceanobacillus luteolus]|uniref:Restriction endonuclease type IV Mrr domain-containing protein n=1 Tax=Oceanobacillus luteolus TaxID=1274358 RepID=A0ABW4HN27_9BACI